VGRSFRSIPESRYRKSDAYATPAKRLPGHVPIALSVGVASHTRRAKTSLPVETSNVWPKPELRAYWIKWGIDMSVGFRWTKGGSSNYQPGVWLWFDYDTEIIAKIKAKIPPDSREWQPDNGRWWVHESYLDKVDEIFRGFLEAYKAQIPLF